MRQPKILLAGLLLLSPFPALAERKPVAAQIQLPHNYYYREMYLKAAGRDVGLLRRLH